MTDQDDARLTAILQQESPRAPDPLFRILVLERREAQRLGRRAALGAAIIASAVALSAVIAWAADERMLETFAVLLFGVVLTAALLALAPHVGRALRRLRS